MKISLSWLNEWIDIEDVDPAVLAHRLTMAGLEVDAVEYLGAGHDDIVVGQIASINEHPNADRLVLCEVDLGSVESPGTIVCGATNMEEGDRIPVALPGSSPPGVDFAIESREVMGELSSGMLCSGEELEIEDDADGLLILDEETELGAPIYEALRMQDVVLEIDLTPNRADCLSHRGVAREVAAIYDRPMRSERQSVDVESLGKAQLVDLQIGDRQGCPQYRMAILERVEMGPSPAWLQQRLVSVGVRPVNWVVDVTNFILMDVGQPLHAFDLDKLEGDELIVRRAEEGEVMEGIDHVEYELTPEDLVIADGEKPVALAGVMGGAETEVSDETTRILLECAYFEPTTVRRSAKRHGLHTESSHRFERGIDAGSVNESMWRALELIDQVQHEVSATVPQRVDVGVAGKEPTAVDPIPLSVQRVETLLGISIDGERCRTLLESLGIEIVSMLTDDEMVCRPPSHRGDLRRPADLVEEVARLHGYDEIPAVLPSVAAGAGHRRRTGEPGKATIESREQRRLGEWVRRFLLDQGLQETITYSFMGDEDLERLRLDEDDERRRSPRVANPLVSAQSRMRTTLVPAMLDNLGRNFSNRRSNLAFFEIGRRYTVEEEHRTLCVAVTGEVERHWSGRRPWDFFDLKGLVEALATPFDVRRSRWRRPDEDEPFLHPGVQAAWFLDGDEVGRVGQIHPAVAQDEGFTQKVFIAEIDLEALLDRGAKSATAPAVVKYPSMVRDFALIAPEDRAYAEVSEALESLAGDEDSTFGSIFESHELFDVYEGQQVKEGYRSLAITVTYRSDERTLTDQDVEEADRQLLEWIEDKVGAVLR